MATQWFYARGGQQLGPVSFEELQQLAARGEVQAGDLVWSEGMSNWSPASSVANLMPAGAPTAPPMGTPPPAAAAAPPSAGPEAMGMVTPQMSQQQPVGYQGPSMGMQPLSYGGAPPKNYLVQSILVTICCCIPLGIVAIVYAAQVNSKYEAGDVAGAEESSRKAKMWCLIALCAGLVANVIGVGIRLAAERR